LSIQNIWSTFVEILKYKLMTRINSAIRVRLLTDEHLLAEHRELPRICSVYSKRKQSKLGFKNLPTQFTLGTGHVLYFVDKAAFTAGRYLDIYEECINRGFNVENYFDNWKVYESENNDFIFNDHIPTIREYNLLVVRITERLIGSKKPYWHYYGKQITKTESIKILNTPFGEYPKI